MARWVARNSDGMWMMRDAGDPALILTQPASYTEHDVPGTQPPDPRLTRADGTSPTKTRAATAPEMAAYDAAVLDTEVIKAVDQERLISAVVWTILDTYAEFKPATIPKYQNARSKIVTVYKSQPWKP